MVSMSKKLYKDSPKVERDEETGKMAIKRGANKDANDAMENEGEGAISEVHDSHLKDMLERHQDELKSLHDDHLDQIKNFHEKYMGKEGEKEEKKSEK